MLPYEAGHLAHQEDSCPQADPGQDRRRRGDRLGRRRMFAVGIAIFTAASAAAALAPSIAALDAARAVQGLGGALVTPLTLTMLSAAVPANKRGLALDLQARGA